MKTDPEERGGGGDGGDGRPLGDRDWQVFPV
jgi:hypothetical protein